MADLIYVAVVVGFFAIAYLLVLACDRIMRRADLSVVQGDRSDEAQGRAA